MTATAPGRNVTIGGRHLAVTPVSGPPNASDLDRGRRPGTLGDFRELLMLSQSFDQNARQAPSFRAGKESAETPGDLFGW